MLIQNFHRISLNLGKCFMQRLIVKKVKSLVTLLQCQFRSPSLILYIFFTSTGIQLCNVINTSSFSMHIHPMTTYIMSANTICQCIKFNLRILFIFVKFVSLFDTFLSYELLLASTSTSTAVS